MMNPPSENDPIGSSNNNVAPKIETLVSEKRAELLEELNTAMEKEIWNDAECNKFVGQLIETGDLKDSKEKCGGKIPAPPSARSTVRMPADHDGQRQPDTAGMGVVAFIRYAAKCSRDSSETSPEEGFNVSVMRQRKPGWFVLISDHDDQLVEQKIREIEEKETLGSVDDLILNWTYNRGETKKKLFDFAADKKPSKADLDYFFGLMVQRADKLGESLPKLTPLCISESIEKINTAYVDFEPKNANDFFLTKNKQVDKSYAIVVAGESGSGKSVFACHQSKEHGLLPLYIVLTSDHFKDTRKPKDLGDYKNLNHLFDLAIKMADEDDRTVLYSLKHKVNLSRDCWAMDVLAKALKIEKDKGSAAVWEWFAGRWDTSNRPDRVAIILDEATDIDLVEGLISTVREITSLYANLAKDEVQLVIVGVGLDVIKEKGRVGTNPTYSKLVVMKSPIPEQLGLDNEVLQALKNGTFSRVLKTNTRMFFRSVLPELKRSEHRVDTRRLSTEAKRARLEQRLTAVGSFWELMDHAPRLYVDQNSTGTLSLDDLHSLLLQAFAYHLVDSMRKATKPRGSVKGNMDDEIAIVEGFDDYKKLQSDPQNNFLAKGLGSRCGTSAALKYLACFGYTCELRPTFGAEFEEMVALHFMRYMEAQQYTVIRFTLLHAWPPHRSKGGISLPELCQRLSEHKEPEVKNLDAQWKTKPDSGKWCLIFSQGTASAQGGDIFALLLNMDEKKGTLETIQCKHFAKPPSKGICHKWWDSLGVSFAENGVEDLHPKEGSAGYSYLGFQYLQVLLSEWLGKSRVLSVELGKRTLAMSFDAPKSFPIPKDKRCRAWFKEMFEPTISVLPPKAAPPLLGAGEKDML